MSESEQREVSVSLRHFNHSDNQLISSRLGLSPEKANTLIDEWNAGSFNGAYFEMFAVQNDDMVIGTISLYAHSASILSIGPEIFEAYRRRGFAKAAMTAAMTIAKSKSKHDHIVLQQVRTNNSASIRLHTSLGFERDRNIYKNQNGNDVYIFLKTI